MAAVMRRHFPDSTFVGGWWFRVVFFFCAFFIFLSLLILHPSTQDGLGMPGGVWGGVCHAVHGRVGKREVFRRGGGMAVNAVYLNALYGVGMLWLRNVFSEA